MSLLQFIQKPIEIEESDTRFPLTVIYPAGASIAVPKTWRRLPTGEIEAIYNDYQELYWSVHISMWLKEWSSGTGQPALFL